MKLNESKSISAMLVTLILLIGGAIRVGIAHQDLLWVDELHTSWVTIADWQQVTHRAGQGNQTPLYFWITWPVVQLLGQSNFSLRLMSLVAGLMLIPTACWITWKLVHSVIATFVAAWLIAFDSWFTFYGTEARPYALLELLGLVQALLFWKLLILSQEPPSNRSRQTHVRTTVSLTIASATLVYCHLTCVWLFVAELIFLLVWWAVPNRQVPASFQTGPAIRPFIVTMVGTFLLCLPAIPNLLEVFGRRDNWITVSSPLRLTMDYCWPLFSQIAVPAVAVGLICRLRRRNDSNVLGRAKSFSDILPMLGFLLSCAMMPIVCVVSLDWLRVAPLALYRYTVVGAAAIPLFAAMSVGLSGKWPIQLAMAAMILLASLVDGFENGNVRSNQLANQWFTGQLIPQLRYENWRDPVNEINQGESKRNQPVYLFPNLVEDSHSFTSSDPEFQRYLLFPVKGIHQVDLSNRRAIAAPTLGQPHLRPGDIQNILEHRGAWFLIRGDTELVIEICDEFQAWISSEPYSTWTSELGDSDREANDQTAAKSEAQVRYAQFPRSNVYLVSIDL